MSMQMRWAMERTVSLSVDAQSVRMSFPILMSVLEIYPRHIKVGDSEGWCGPSLMALILRPFTPGEDAVVAWATAQDDTNLLDLVHMADGRDYVVLERLHVKQSLRQALQEQNEYLAEAIWRIPMQHDTRHDTPR
jgi:hypothetical protein